MAVGTLQGSITEGREVEDKQWGGCVVSQHCSLCCKDFFFAGILIQGGLEIGPVCFFLFFMSRRWYRVVGAAMIGLPAEEITVGGCLAVGNNTCPRTLPSSFVLHLKGGGILELNMMLLMPIPRCF